MRNQAKGKRSVSSTLRYLNSSAHGMVPILRAGGDTYLWIAGHFRRRECMATRFHYRNVTGRCKKENRFEGGQRYEFGFAIDKKFGAGTVQKLF